MYYNTTNCAKKMVYDVTTLYLKTKICGVAITLGKCRWFCNRPVMTSKSVRPVQWK